MASAWPTSAARGPHRGPTALVSPLVGLKLHDSRLQRRFYVDVLEVHRCRQKLQPSLAQLRLAAGNRLLLRCNRSELLCFRQRFNATASRQT